ncbi:MAG: hypothetical protein H7222_11570 [Methylotenera sp.]|nr:hypothetical protein [Oligoflexia bacterium]
MKSIAHKSAINSVIGLTLLSLITLTLRSSFASGIPLDVLPLNLDDSRFIRVSSVDRHGKADEKGTLRRFEFCEKFKSFREDFGIRNRDMIRPCKLIGGRAFSLTELRSRRDYLHSQKIRVGTIEAVILVAAVAGACAFPVFVMGMTSAKVILGVGSIAAVGTISYRMNDWNRTPDYNPFELNSREKSIREEVILDRDETFDGDMERLATRMDDTFKTVYGGK